MTAARAPTDTDRLTVYDHNHLNEYLRLLDADGDGVPWEVAARDILGLDPDHDPSGAWATWDSHLDRAKWIRDGGYRLLLR